MTEIATTSDLLIMIQINKIILPQNCYLHIPSQFKLYSLNYTVFYYGYGVDRKVISNSAKALLVDYQISVRSQCCAFITLRKQRVYARTQC